MMTTNQIGSSLPVGSYKRGTKWLVFYFGMALTWCVLELSILLYQGKYASNVGSGSNFELSSSMKHRGSIFEIHPKTPQAFVGSDPNKNSHPSAIICSMIKDENRYLEEWTLYHLALGFEEVHIYDNSDTAAAQKWHDEDQAYNPVIQKRVHIHSHITKEKKRQVHAFRKCMKNHGTRHTWVAYFDSDEFLVLKQHETVVDFLSQHCVNGSLGINWQIFGTANTSQYVDEPVTKRFQYHMGVDSHIKTIVKSADFEGMTGVHWVKHDNSRMRRDTSGHWIRGIRRAGVLNPTYHPGGPVNVAALHHYKYRSLEEFNFKGCTRGYSFNQKRCFNHTLDELPAGHIFDETAWKLLQKLLPKYRMDPGS